MDSIFVSATDLHKRYFMDLRCFRDMYSSLVHAKSKVPVVNKSLDYACFSACLPSCPKHLNWKLESPLSRTRANQKTGNRRWLDCHVLAPKNVGRSQSLQILQLRARNSSYTEIQTLLLNKGFNDSGIRNALFTFIYLTAKS